MPNAQVRRQLPVCEDAIATAIAPPEAVERGREQALAVVERPQCR
jgi:hypothetical protein